MLHLGDRWYFLLFCFNRAWPNPISFIWLCLILFLFLENWCKKKAAKLPPTDSLKSLQDFFFPPVLDPVLADNSGRFDQICNMLTPWMSIFEALCFASVTKRAATHLKRVAERKKEDTDISPLALSFALIRLCCCFNLPVSWLSQGRWG